MNIKNHTSKCMLLMAAAIISTSTMAASSANKKTSELKTQIALEYIKIGNLDSAKLALDEALLKNPANAAAMMTMAVTYQLVGTKESMEYAAEYFKKAIQLEPKNPQIHNNYGQYLFVTEKYPEAVEQFKISANTIGYINRDNSLNNLAQTYLKMNKLDDAKLYFLRALQVNPRLAEALFGLSECYYLLDQMDAANDVFADYVELVERKNFDEKALWLAIRIHKHNGDSISVKEYVKVLAEKYPKSNEYRKYLQQKDLNKKWL